MLDHLKERANHVAGHNTAQQIARLALDPRWPKGVRAEATADGVRLSGRNLKARYLRDSQLRSVIHD